MRALRRPARGSSSARAPPGHPQRQRPRPPLRPALCGRPSAPACSAAAAAAQRGPAAAAAAAPARRRRVACCCSSSGLLEQQQHEAQPPQAQQRPVPLQVTRANFAAALPAVRRALESCQFFAFDCEMSGLFLAGQEDYTVDDVDDRFVKTAAAADAFTVTQFGLSAFAWHPADGSDGSDGSDGARAPSSSGDGGGCYVATSFNFALFPSPSEERDLRFSCQASSLAFLAAQGFDFNKMIYEGVPFVPLSLRDRRLKASEAAASPPDLADCEDDELQLVEQLESSIAAWLERTPSPAAGGGDGDGGSAAAQADTLYLPAPPPQLLRLQQQLLAAGIGSSRWQRRSGGGGGKRSGSGSSSSSSSSSSSDSEQRLYMVQPVEAGAVHIGSSSAGSSGGVVLVRASAAQLAAAAARDEASRAAAASAACGFSQVFEAIRECRKPAVGHNVRFDLAFALASFVQSPLPRSWPRFKELVAEWFPGGVYDTKHLAHALTGAASGSDAASPSLLPDTSLGGVFAAFNASAASGLPLTAPQPSAVLAAGTAANTAGLAEWLAEATAPLDDPAAWATLPRVRHALGCEAYAAAAAAAVAADGDGAAAASFAHEAGYDAFMTGLIFIGLMRLHEVAGLRQLSRWVLPPAPAAPPSLDAVQALGWRQHHGRSRDITYAALRGPEAVPHRPEVLYLSGLKGQRWQDIQRHFQRLGLGRPTVSLVRELLGSGHCAVTGAYVIMPSAKDASKALQLLRQDGSKKQLCSKAMSYADYFYSKHSRHASATPAGSSSSSSSSSSGGGGGSPAAAAAAAAGEGGTAAAAVVQEMQGLAQQLRRKAAHAKEQRRREEQQAQQQQQQAEQAELQAQEQQEQQQQQQQQQAAASLPQAEAPSLPGDGGRAVQQPRGAPASSAEAARLAASQQRLAQLQRGGGAALQRPALRPAPSS